VRIYILQFLSYTLEQKITDHYVILEELGRGAYAIVNKGVHKQHGHMFAVKMIDVGKSDSIDAMLCEIGIMQVGLLISFLFDFFSHE
jgi:hypothetical protein